MLTSIRRWSTALAAAVLLWACGHSHGTDRPSEPAPMSSKRKPFVLTLPTGDDYQSLLEGPPQTLGYRSGRVVLQPGDSVGEHDTEHYEEVLVVLEGRGKAVAKGHGTLDIAAGNLVYVPPHTQHDVHNVGEGRLVYIYLVAPTER